MFQPRACGHKWHVGISSRQWAASLADQLYEQTASKLGLATSSPQPLHAAIINNVIFVRLCIHCSLHVTGDTHAGMHSRTLDQRQHSLGIF